MKAFTATLPLILICGCADDAATPRIEVNLSESRSGVLANAMAALRYKMAVIENNIANADTPAFKRSEVALADVSYSSVSLPGSELAQGNGVLVTGVTREFRSGSLRGTGRNLDVAVDGRGFFEVKLMDGSAGFTRNGRFQVNADGKICTSGGLLVQPEISLSQDVLDLSISPEGLVSGRTGSSPDTTTQFGQLQLTNFINPDGLLAQGENNFRETPDSGPVIRGNPGDSGFGTVRQAFLEDSNVVLETEIASLRWAREQYDLLQQLMLQR